MISGSKIVKPLKEVREYKHIVLENELNVLIWRYLIKVLLISDLQADKSAASMSVGVGT